MPVMDLNNAKKTVLRIDLVGHAPELREAVKQVLARVTEPPMQLFESDQPGGSEASGEGPIDVSMVLFSGDNDKSLAYLQSRSAQTPRPALFGLLKDRSPGLMKRVIRAGADELLFLPLDPGDLTRALLKVSETRIRVARHEGGMVVSLASISWAE